MISLALPLASGLVALMVILGVSKELATNWFPLTSVIAATLSILLFLFSALVEDIEQRGPVAGIKLVYQRWRLALLWSGLLTGIIYMAVGTEIRVLTDESTLLSTALSIYLRGRAHLITMGLEFNDQYLPLSTQIPLRPVLYPLLIAAAHALTGYRVANGFVINFAGMIVAFTAVIGLARAARQPVAGYMATALMAGFPLIALTATSCGLEALNLALVLTTFYFLFHLVKVPSWRRFELTLYSSILASQCRYETALLVLVTLAAGVLVARSLLGTMVPARLLLAPWITGPMIWQRRISSSINGNDKVEAAFSLENLPANLKNAAEFFNPWSSAPYPISSTVVLFAIVGLVLMIIRIQLMPPAERLRRIHFLLLIGSYLVATLLVQCLYYMGDLREPQLMRIGVIYASSLCILAAYMLSVIARRHTQQLIAAILIGAITATGLTVAATNEHGKTHAGYMEFKRNLSLIETYPREGTLVIDDHPVMYVPARIGSVNFEYANKTAAQVLGQFDAKILQHILVIQRLVNGHPTEATHLSPEYELIPILEYRTTADYTVRIASARSRSHL